MISHDTTYTQHAYLSEAKDKIIFSHMYIIRDIRNDMTWHALCSTFAVDICLAIKTIPYMKIMSGKIKAAQFTEYMQNKNFRIHK